MRFAVIAAAFAIVSAPAFAADAPATRSDAAVAHQGDMLRDANNVRLGSIDSVDKDGSVGIIYNSHYVTIPAASLTLVNGKLTTKLTKTEIGAL